MPRPVLGGAAIVMFGLIVSAGLELVARSGLTTRNMPIAAISPGLGMGLWQVERLARAAGFGPLPLDVLPSRSVPLPAGCARAPLHSVLYASLRSLHSVRGGASTPRGDGPCAKALTHGEGGRINGFRPAPCAPRGSRHGAGRPGAITHEERRSPTLTRAALGRHPCQCQRRSRAPAPGGRKSKTDAAVAPCAPTFRSLHYATAVSGTRFAPFLACLRFVCVRSIPRAAAQCLRAPGAAGTAPAGCSSAPLHSFALATLRACYGFRSFLASILAVSPLRCRSLIPCAARTMPTRLAP